MNTDKASMRYAGRLTAIYDWAFSGICDRTPERLSRADCIEAIRNLWNSYKDDKDVDRLWSLVSNDFPGIGNKQIEEASFWNLREVCRLYDMQRRELEAVEVLKSLYEKDGRGLFEIADENHVYPWTLTAWMDYGKRITWFLVQSIEALKEAGKPFDLNDALKGMAEMKRRYTEKK